MNSIACVICGAKKDSANKWWVLFEGAPSRAVVIGPIDEAENLSQWQPGMTRFPLCGAECLFRKLHGTLHPPNAGAGKKPQRGEDGESGITATNPDAGTGSENGQRILPAPLRGILHRVTDLKSNSSEQPSRLRDEPATSNQKSPAKLRQIAAINEGVTINGQIQSDESLYFNGELSGTLVLPHHRLTVGPYGKIRAAVQAREVEILGFVEGDVRADKVVVRKNASLIGNIWTVVLVIEEGAVFDGRCSKAPARDVPVPKRIGVAASS